MSDLNAQPVESTFDALDGSSRTRPYCYGRSVLEVLAGQRLPLHISTD